MIQITPHMRILVAVNPIDFRKGIDGLAATCRRLLKADPFSGALFVFRNRLKTAIKILVYDGQGFWLFQKRLSSGRFRWWPDFESDEVSRLAVYELQLLLAAGNPSSTKVMPDWRRLPESSDQHV